MGFLAGLAVMVLATLDGLDSIPRVLGKVARMHRLGPIATALRIQLPHADDAELGHRGHIASIDFQNAIVAGSRRAEIFAEESEVAQPAQGFDMIGYQLQDLLARRGGLIVLSFLDTNRGQGNQGLRKARVLALSALKDEGRFFQPARGPQVVAEYDRVFGCELPLLVEQAQIRDGEVVSSRRSKSDGPCAPGHE